VSRIAISVDIDRTPDEVWDDVRHVASHVEWMQDATEIRFLSDRTEGVGTRFECDTRVGPLKVTDVMEITDWQDAQRMGVLHQGLVTGTGAFTLAPGPAGGTRFAWEEELRFPWWLGGPIGERVGAPILRRIWRGNLRRLRARLEG
jgi:hypothetical protein